MVKINNTVKEVLEWIYCIVIALILALIIRYFVGTPTVVQHVSMQHTLEPGQRLILNRLVRTFKQEINRGDIITFEAPSSQTTDSIIAKYENEPTNIFSKFSYYVLEVGKTSYIKRVIALPGEKVKIHNGKVYINDQELEEDYLGENVLTEVKNAHLIEFTVPEGYVFAMGDNRSQSLDCRSFGCIPISKIESKVWIRFWPFDLFGEVDK